MTMAIKQNTCGLRLVVSENVQKLGILHPIACLIKNVTVQPGKAVALDEEIETLMGKIATQRDQFLNKPEVQGFRSLFNAMGYADQTPAGERLFDSFAQRGFKRIDNIVDAYNVVALETVSGLGMHDADKFLEESKPLYVWRAEGGEKIIPMFDKKYRKVKKGDILYGMKDENMARPIAWLGKRDKDSDEFKVTKDTTSLLFVVLGNEKTTKEYNNNICQRTLDLIKLSCPEAEMEMVNVEKDGSSCN